MYAAATTQANQALTQWRAEASAAEESVRSVVAESRREVEQLKVLVSAETEGELFSLHVLAWSDQILGALMRSLPGFWDVAV